MTEKVKITREQAEAIKWLKERVFTAEDVIVSHATRPNNWTLDQNKALNGMPLLNLIDAYRFGYEVEEEYKVGDWVADTLSGSIGKVVRVGNDFVELDGGEVPSFDYARHATPEEIKAEQERRVWAKIGRGVMEFRHGDSARHINDSSISDIDFLKACYKAGTLKGFYPAESFVLFGGGEDA